MLRVFAILSGMMEHSRAKPATAAILDGRYGLDSLVRRSNISGSAISRVCPSSSHFANTPGPSSFRGNLCSTTLNASHHEAAAMSARPRAPNSSIRC